MLRLKPFALLLTIALQLTLALPVTAAEQPGSFALGRQYFDQGRFDDAYRELYEAFKKDPANLDLSFYLGQAAFESGRLEEAVMAYDRILISEPESARVKLELARAHLRLGSRELAKQFFREVLATNPPEAVVKNIERFLAAIAESEKRHFLNGMVAAGFAMDDNVNVAPDNKIVEIRAFGINLPVTIDQNAIRDNIYSSTLVVNHLYKNEEWPLSWKTAATSYNAFYEKQNVNDLNFLNINSGPSWQTEKTLFQLYGQLTKVNVEYDPYLDAYGLGANLTVLLRPELFLILNAGAQQKDHSQDDGKDADNFLLSLSPVINLGLNRISLSSSAELENARLGTNSYFRYSLGCRYDRQLPYDIGAFASIRLQDTRYDEVEPLYATRRSDTSYDLAVGLSKLLWQSVTKKQSLSGLLSYTMTQADSTISVYEYSKDVVALGVTLTF